MAGDWIKMRIGLQSDPHVVRIVSALNADELRTTNPEPVRILSDRFRVVGALHAVWCLFDQHSRDGNLTYTPSEMDALIGFHGFSKALIGAGWMDFDGHNTLTMHNFEAHNGKSAKRRASEAIRKQFSRHSVRNLSAFDADKNGTREEKRREGDSLSLNTKSVSSLQKLNPKKASGAKFAKPLLAEVEAYLAERKSHVNAQAFVGFYESKGWRVGNQPMRDWKAAVRTWEQREKANGHAGTRLGPCERHPESRVTQKGYCWDCYAEQNGLRG